MTKLVFNSLENIEQNFALLELIPDTHAWVKDRDGLFVFGSRLFYERFNISSMQGLVGKTDYDLAPADMAQHYRADDDRVLDGYVVTDRLELILGKSEPVEWFLTSKWPVYNPEGYIIGSVGLSRHLNQSERKLVPYQELSKPIDYIQQYFASRISVEKLATACNLSVSALERRFKKHLHKTPYQYITEVRLEHAKRLLLETEKGVGTIALETGFADHSHFTRVFSKHFGQTPSSQRSARTTVTTG
ncbi:MAG: AraC-like DNA-binding protein [Halieaceae bacterium]|jgi:AraC-like DNA-binding protein